MHTVSYLKTYVISKQMINCYGEKSMGGSSPREFIEEIVRDTYLP